ncbi:MAG: Haloacid dehalogenase domain protein hydrolase [Verrucomicrobia bacterium]|nr:Haloacid dehalogenase domain protein hydrolase [Verrucomicrobiota bacterium]
MKTLVLWDIDGTLTLSGGAGMRALQAALKREFGVDRSLYDIDYAGRTDRHIMRQIFGKIALPDHDGNLARFLEAYLIELPHELKNPGSRILPGISAALAALEARPDFAQALLTGNVERGARIKLGHHGLSHFFKFGAFADDSALRNELGPIAVRRAREHHGIDFAADRIFVIGDTPHDIECGKIINARTIAVATGHYSVEQLREHQPTAVLADLSDTEGFLRLVGAA